ncbi:MAG: hypothetical protein Q4G71_14865 [Pseudomonadota bacterium]|nr:hypothetical protein [Pseudomonadota bacterium]
MKYLDGLLELIAETKFFTKVGSGQALGAEFISMSINEIFINECPGLPDAQIKKIIWLPTTNDQSDPFYGGKSFPSDLATERMRLNQAVLTAIRKADFSQFKIGAHDFSRPAIAGASFAFRARLGEQSLGLGNTWEPIVAGFVAGRWPVGVLDNRIITA